MDYNDIPLFVRVVEAGSFTAAAQALGTQKSSVSRSVSRLEQELGVRLLQRTTRKLALTDAGQAFFERVRGVVVGVDEAADAVKELGGKPRGIVRVSAMPDAHALGLPEAIAGFCEKYPAIHVECMLAARRVDLVAEGFDMAVRAGRLEDSTLVARRIGAPALLLFASPAYLRRRGRPKTLADLTRHDCVLHHWQGGREIWTLTGPRGEETVEVRGALSVDEMMFAVRACAAGMGVALLPVLVALETVRRGELEALLTDYAMTSGELNIVLPSSTFVPTRVALLRDHLVEHLRREIEAGARQCAKHKPRRSS
jgi:DNA-binding transcriptional LysR family regulator